MLFRWSWHVAINQNCLCLTRRKSFPECLPSRGPPTTATDHHNSGSEPLVEVLRSSWAPRNCRRRPRRLEISESEGFFNMIFRDLKTAISVYVIVKWQLLYDGTCLFHTISFKFHSLCHPPFSNCPMKCRSNYAETWASSSMMNLNKHDEITPFQITQLNYPPAQKYASADQDPRFNAYRRDSRLHVMPQRTGAAAQVYFMICRKNNGAWA